MMKRLLMVALIALPFAASANAAFKDCSMKAGKMTSKTDLMKMAKVKPEEAKTIALNDAKGSQIVKGGIETEDGCLVYSYHVKEPTGKGQTEIFVDAGNGAVLKREHEGGTRAALEKPVDKTKELAGRTKEAVTGEPSTNHSMTK
jgi:uncharacterized membrane protein YkoI